MKGRGVEGTSEGDGFCGPASGRWIAARRDYFSLAWTFYLPPLLTGLFRPLDHTGTEQNQTYLRGLSRINVRGDRSPSGLLDTLG